MNMKSLLKRLYSLALHPSAAKRLGASLAFNNIYTIFRQDIYGKLFVEVRFPYVVQSNRFLDNQSTHRF